MYFKYTLNCKKHSQPRDTMKKILFLFTIASMLTTSLFAQTTTTQSNEKLVEKYLEVSGQGDVFKTIPTQMVNMMEQQFAAVGEKADPQVLDLMIEEFTKEATVTKMTENIRKLSTEDLNKLIAFYTTKTGQKCATLNKEEDMENMHAELPTFIQGLQDNPPSEHRIESMNTMFMETNILTGALGMVESIIRIFNANAPKEKQMNDEQMAGQLIVTFYYALRNFSDNEIDEIVKVTLTPEGQAETDAQLTDLTAYFNTATTDLVAAIEKLQK